MNSGNGPGRASTRAARRCPSPRHGRPLGRTRWPAAAGNGCSRASPGPGPAPGPGRVWSDSCGQPSLWAHLGPAGITTHSVLQRVFILLCPRLPYPRALPVTITTPRCEQLCELGHIQYQLAYTVGGSKILSLMRKWRLRKVKCSDQSHVALKGQSWNWNSPLPTPGLCPW